MSDKENNPAISVSNLVNLSNLERVFDEIFDKISTINARMDKLENDFSTNVSLTRFLSLQNEYESNINLFENRIKYLEQNISEVKPIITKSKYNEENIDKLREKSKSLVTNEMFESSLNDLEMTISDKMEQISSSKCGNQRAKNLEQSTKTICSQISAIESLLNCKVDKSQIPLMQSCQQQLQNLETFRDDISERVAIVSDQISDITSNLNQKIDESLFDETKTEIDKLMTKKVDMSFLNEEIIKRLNTLLPDLLVLLKEHKQISTSQCFNEIQTLNISIKQMTEKLNVNKNNIDNILKSLFNVPSVQQMEIKADKEFCRNLTQQSKEFCENNCNHLKQNIDELNKEINKLKIISNSLNEKTKVALRFVDWYSSLQLET